VIYLNYTGYLFSPAEYPWTSTHWENTIYCSACASLAPSSHSSPYLRQNPLNRILPSGDLCGPTFTHGSCVRLCGWVTSLFSAFFPHLRYFSWRHLLVSYISVTYSRWPGSRWWLQSYFQGRRKLEQEVRFLQLDVW